jgi:N,N-dimethylformamidase
VELLGYTQPVVARPAQTVEVKVSTTQPVVTAEVVRLGLTDGPVLSTATFPGRRQDLVSGSYFLAALDDGPGTGGLTVQFWFLATRLAERQCLLAGSGPDGGWEVAIGPDARLSAAVLTAEGEVLRAVSAGPVITERQWYFAAVCWHDTGRVSIAVAPRRGRFGDIAEHDLAPAARWPRTVSVAAAVLAGRPLRCFNGKVDTPRLFAGVLPPDALRALAADAPAARIPGLRHEWRFGAAAATPPFRVPDHGPGRRDGTLVNMPTLGVTGRNWTPAGESFVLAPEQYQAAHFHSDDLGDAGWETDWRFEVPEDWPSGVYGIRLRAGEHADTVPLIVSAAGRPRAAAAVLLPTFSYLAYANEHASWERPIKASIGGAAEMIVTDADRFTSRHRLLSLYELHEDGSGTAISSWRRPVLNLRPGYHLPLVRGPHQFSADLELLHWLESRGADVDVITDDDLHSGGVRTLEPYRVVLTGSHPEYVSGQILDGIERYLDAGGRLMYLGGNGFYWVTTAPQDPWVIEVRRGMAGTRVWESPPGELHQAMTGERGGLWRHRGRPPQALAGVGFTGQGFDRSLPYRVSPDAPGFIVAGIDPAVLIGDGGSVLGGAAGFEIDRMDMALGTPPDAVLVASARGFSDAYQGAVEDVTTADSQQGGSVSELVRSDVVFFETAAGGAVFSVGSIAWCGALRDTPVGQLTWNVLSRFLDPTPFSTAPFSTAPFRGAFDAK